MNVSQVADSLAPKAKRSEERQGDSQGSAQATDSPTPEARPSGCYKRVLQHGFDVVDDLAFKAGQSAATQRASNSYEGSIIEEFRDLDKLGQGFISTDPLEEIDIGDGKTPRPTFINKTLEVDPRDEMIGLLKEYSDCFAWNYTGMLGLS